MADQDRRSEWGWGSGDRRADEAGDSRPRPGAPDDARGKANRRRAVLGISGTVGAALLLGAVGLGFVYHQLGGNIAGVDINARLGTDRPEDVANGSLDILVLGSDTRSGANAAYGSDGGGARSDTAMIVHVAEGHDRATIVSIPRDTLVNRPECEKPDGSVAEADPQAMFNESYQVGGPACAVKTVEEMTDIRMDHYVEVDFTGFKKLVNTLGGVPVTVERPLQDADSHLDLSAGTHTLDGEQALALVRTRHAVGNGSDLGRIQLQHAFLKALLAKIDDVSLFSDPGLLYELADTATSAVTTDTDLDSPTDLLGVAKLLKGVEPDDTQMLTMPVRYDPQDPNRVLPLEGRAEQVWKALRADRKVPASATEGSAGSEENPGAVRR